MTDESNGESTFEFVEKKSEDYPTNELKPGSRTSLTNTSSTMSGGNLLSNIAPPSTLLSFVTNPSEPKTIETEHQAEPKEEPIPSTERKDSLSIESQLLETGALAGNLFSWMKETVANSSVLSKVAEKAKNSVNSMITTLDPQMREFIYSGGDVEIVVASEKDSKVSPIREAFQNVFGKATVSAIAAESTSAVQPVGFDAGIKAAQERIKIVRNNPLFPPDVPVVAVESFLLEVGLKMWYELSVILLEDRKRDIRLQTFTQMTPVPSQVVETAKEATPLECDGFSVTIGSLMGANLEVPHTEWHSALTGISRKDVVLLAAQSLAGLYKNTINPV